MVIYIYIYIFAFVKDLVYKPCCIMRGSCPPAISIIRVIQKLLLPYVVDIQNIISNAIKTNAYLE